MNVLERRPPLRCRTDDEKKKEGAVCCAVVGMATAAAGFPGNLVFVTYDYHAGLLFGCVVWLPRLGCRSCGCRTKHSTRQYKSNRREARSILRPPLAMAPMPLEKEVRNPPPQCIRLIDKTRQVHASGPARHVTCNTNNTPGTAEQLAQLAPAG